MRADTRARPYSPRGEWPARGRGRRGIAQYKCQARHLELKLDLGNQFASSRRFDISLIERSPCRARVIGKLMRDPIEFDTKLRFKRRGRKRVAHNWRKQRSGMVEIWLEIT
jgi:hypothetical protein